MDRLGYVFLVMDKEEVIIEKSRDDIDIISRIETYIPHGK